VIFSRIYKTLAAACLIVPMFVSCRKTAETKTDGRLDSNKYCNDPQAVNYNVGFPGLPDNTLCFFPTQLFKGNYLFIDSVLDKDLKFKSADSFNIQMIALNNVRIAFVGFCGKGSTDTIYLTANKYYKAVPDSTNGPYDTKLNGYLVCGDGQKGPDTLTGYMQKYNTDSNKVLIRFNVNKVDTTLKTNYHYGTAIKQ